MASWMEEKKRLEGCSLEERREVQNIYGWKPWFRTLKSTHILNITRATAAGLISWNLKRSRLWRKSLLPRCLLKKKRESNKICSRIMTWRCLRRQETFLPRYQITERKYIVNYFHQVSIYKGDNTKLEVDAIVNAANNSLMGDAACIMGDYALCTMIMHFDRSCILVIYGWWNQYVQYVNVYILVFPGGGGVDGAIHRAAGPHLRAENYATHVNGWVFYLFVCQSVYVFCLFVYLFAFS